MKTSQSLRLIREQYDALAMTRELDFLHKRLNDLAISPALTNLKTDYAAGDLGTAAAIATAFNATNTAINVILGKINLT